MEGGAFIVESGRGASMAIATGRGGAIDFEKLKRLGGDDTLGADDVGRSSGSDEAPTSSPLYGRRPCCVEIKNLCGLGGLEYVLGAEADAGFGRAVPICGGALAFELAGNDVASAPV